MVRGGIHVLDMEDVSHVMEELSGEATAVMREEFDGRTLIKDPLVLKAVHHLCGRYTLQWDRLHQLGNSIGYEGQESVVAKHPHKLSEDVNPYGFKRRSSRE